MNQSFSVGDIRKKYLSFFSSHDHNVVPSASLVPENDPTTLFTGSGMQPLIPYLLGQAHPKGVRLVNSQKCFRAEDVDEVGDNRHTTFFEMLGNWSLGDYFKNDQLKWLFTFLVDEVGLDPARLYITVFSGDTVSGVLADRDSVSLWQNLFSQKGMEASFVELIDEETGGRLGMQGGRIFAYGPKKNWWSRSGVPENMPAGEPGGPDSEVFYEFVDVEHDVRFGEYCHPNCDCGRFVEIGNSVFMEFIKNKDGSFSQLPQRNVDFGGGLERVVAAANDNADIFSIDVFAGLIAFLEEKSSKKYSDSLYTKAFRVVADHVRGAVFMISDGVYPSNTEQGYVLRRLVRRAVRYADILGLPEQSFVHLVGPLVESYRDAYPILDSQRESIESVIRDEETKFRKTLVKGMKELDRMIALKNEISGKDIFVLFTTYGFPVDMTREIVSERGALFDEEGYLQEFRKHQDLSRTASGAKFKGGLADHGDKTTALHTVTHLMLAGLRKELGDHVHQAGSNITQERTRFDFTHPEKVSRDVLDRVEEYVNEAIAKNVRVRVSHMQKEEAKSTGVEGSFWEKYPDVVNVYSVIDDDGVVYSRELCGGPHVEETGVIKGVFRIKKEESSSAGVRRIKAVLMEG